MTYDEQKGDFFCHCKKCNRKLFQGDDLLFPIGTIPPPLKEEEEERPRLAIAGRRIDLRVPAPAEARFIADNVIAANNPAFHLRPQEGEPIQFNDNEHRELEPLGQIRESDNFVCQACKKKMACCKSCNHVYEPKDLKIGYCENCVRSAPKTHVRRYRHRVEQEIGKLGEKPKDRLYYGVELELESSNLGLDILIVHDLIEGFANLKKDSSIKSGFEIVTAPATLEEHYQFWDKFFEKLPQTSRPLQSCGMHIHASRERMSDLQIGKMLVLLHHRRNRKFIEMIAGRGSSFHNNFEAEKSFKDVRVPLLDKFGRPDHHTALNLHKEETIELRIFWATRDKRIFFKNMEFMKALIKFTDWGNNSLNDVLEYRNFVEWVRQQRKEYEYLCLFFETPSMRKLLGE